MQSYSVLQFQAFKFVRGYADRAKILASDDGGFFNKAIGQGSAERIILNDVAEWNRAARCLNKRRRGKLESQHGLEFVDSTHARRGAVAMRLVHQQHKVVQPGKVVEIAVPDNFG